MLTTAVIKNIKALKEKSERTSQGLFIAEGEKLVEELMHSSLQTQAIYANVQWVSDLDKNIRAKFDKQINQITEKELGRISLLKQPNKVIALVNIPQAKTDVKQFIGQTTLAFDNISDPGNLGSIIRIADWFGIKHIICSQNSVDAYNPKVVQASMGSIFRTSVFYCDLNNFISEIKATAQTRVFAATLKGKNIYHAGKQANAILLFGNESHGISRELLKLCDEQISIPNYGEAKKYASAESLNIATSTAILCAEWRREVQG